MPLIRDKKNKSLFNECHHETNNGREISFEGKNLPFLGRVRITLNILLSSILLTADNPNILKTFLEPQKAVSAASESKKILLNKLKQLSEEDFKGINPKVNLHIHSTFSDSKLHVDQIIEQAIKKHKKIISISDHNTTEHLKEIKKYRELAQKNNLEILNSVELTTYHKNSMIHLLVYGADETDSCLNRLCLKAQNHKRLSTIETIKKLSKYYVIVIAHPVVYTKINIAKLIKNLKKAGLDGVEVYYPYKDMDRMLKRLQIPFGTKFLRDIILVREKSVNPKKIAKNLNLISTGGSDSHSLDIDIP